MFLGDFVFLLLGIFLGYLLAMNAKEWKEQKTYEQLDAELRKELEFYKNTCASQKIDVDFYKQKALQWKHKAESQQSPN